MITIDCMQYTYNVSLHGPLLYHRNNPHQSIIVYTILQPIIDAVWLNEEHNEGCSKLTLKIFRFVKVLLKDIFYWSNPLKDDLLVFTVLHWH
jgi:hypothetical protein